MRPVQDIRRSIERAAQALGRGTYRALAETANVGYDAAKATVWNMAREGVLVPVGTAPSGRGRPMVVYAHKNVLPVQGPINDHYGELTSAFASWAVAS